MGIDTAGGVLFELSGQSTLAIDGDAWTSLDRNGNRWWDLEEMSNGTLRELDNLKDELIIISKNVLMTNEFDGITDGIITGQFQLAHADKEELKRNLEPGGLFFVDGADTITCNEEFKSKPGNRDSYQQLIIVMNQWLGKIVAFNILTYATLTQNQK